MLFVVSSSVRLHSAAMSRADADAEAGGASKRTSNGDVGPRETLSFLTVHDCKALAASCLEHKNVLDTYSFLSKNRSRYIGDI